MAPDRPVTAWHGAQAAGLGLGKGLQQELPAHSAPLPFPGDGRAGAGLWPGAGRCCHTPWGTGPHRELSKAVMPKPLQASPTMDPGWRQPSQRGLFRQTLGLRARWAVWPSQSCLVASPEHPRGVFGVLCSHLAVGARGQASSSCCPGQGTGNGHPWECRSFYCSAHTHREVFPTASTAAGPSQGCSKDTRLRP